MNCRRSCRPNSRRLDLPVGIQLCSRLLLSTVLVFCLTTVSAFKSYRSSCYSEHDCIDITNAECYKYPAFCDMGNCICKDGYEPASELLTSPSYLRRHFCVKIRQLNEQCDTNNLTDRCTAGAVCQKICKCKPGYVPTYDGRQCHHRSVSELGGPCRDNSQCLQVQPDNALKQFELGHDFFSREITTVCRYGVCSCPTGYYSRREGPGGLRCHIIQLWDQCSTHGDCNQIGAQCIKKRCECFQSHRPLNISTYLYKQLRVCAHKDAEVNLLRNRNCNSVVGLTDASAKICAEHSQCVYCPGWRENYRCRHNSELLKPSTAGHSLHRPPTTTYYVTVVVAAFLSPTRLSQTVLF